MKCEYLSYTSHRVAYTGARATHVLTLPRPASLRCGYMIGHKTAYYAAADSWMAAVAYLGSGKGAGAGAGGGGGGRGGGRASLLTYT